MIVLHNEYNGIRHKNPDVLPLFFNQLVPDSPLFSLYQRTYLQLMQQDEFPSILAARPPLDILHRCKSSLAQYMSKAWNHSFSTEHIYFLPPAPAGWHLLFQAFEHLGLENVLALPAMPSQWMYTTVPLKWLVPESNPQDNPANTFSYSYSFEQGTHPQALFLSVPNVVTGGIIIHQWLEQLTDLMRRSGGLLVLDQSIQRPIPNLITQSCPPFYQPGMISLHQMAWWGFGTDAPLFLIAEPDILRAIQTKIAVPESVDSLFAHFLEALLQTNEALRICEDVHPLLLNNRYQQVLVSLMELGVNYPITYHSHYGGSSVWIHLAGIPVNSRVVSNVLVNKGVWLPDGHFFYPTQLAGNRTYQNCMQIGIAEEEHTLTQAVERLYSGLEKFYAAI
jgi:alanine-alpha-ketoisovalerate/valine-pyruvate aminotransferase